MGENRIFCYGCGKEWVVNVNKWWPAPPKQLFKNEAGGRP